MEQVAAYIREHADRYVEELKQLLRIQTVSADSAFLSEMKKGAEFVRDRLCDAGCTAELVPTGGHPIVYGEWLGAPGAPTVLIYGHYDVQPPDPLDQWITPAFEPTVRDGKIYARGATDDKGQMYTHIKSVEAWHKATGRLPVNVKFVIEGEEEVGSDHLEQFLEQNKHKLKADVAVISDTSQYAPGIPAVTYGLRGIMACEIRLKGPNQDLHSGTFGGSVANPANILAKLVASLHDEQGRVQIPGFYDDVIELTDSERKQFAALPFDEAQYLKSLGVADGYGEAGYTSTERRWARPTCDVNGFHSGYAGEGPKTIVPARAFAKITCRLVPNQNPKKLIQAMEQYLRRQCPAGVELTFIDQHGCPGLVMDPDSPYMEAARKAIDAAFGREPVLIREGGSIPVVATFGSVLGLGTLLLGWGQNTDNLHSPNEHFSLADYQRGIQASAFLWGELGGKT